MEIVHPAVKVVALVYDGHKQLIHEIPFRAINEKTFTISIDPGGLSELCNLTFSKEVLQFTPKSGAPINELASAVVVAVYSSTGFNCIESLRVHYNADKHEHSHSLYPEKEYLSVSFFTLMRL